jgi:nucleoside-diphosphate-sugar epimerase
MGGVILIGGAGYLGSQIVICLRDLGFEVYIWRYEKDRAESFVENIKSITKKLKIYAIINAAVSYKKNDRKTDGINIELVADLGRIAYAHRLKFVHISTINVAQNIHDGYSLQKKAAEGLLLKFSAERNLDLRIIRLPLLVDERGGWLNRHIKPFLNTILIPQFDAVYAPVVVNVAANLCATVAVDKRSESSIIINVIGRDCYFLAQVIQKFSNLRVLKIPFIGSVLRNVEMFKYFFQKNRHICCVEKGELLIVL